MIQKAESNFGVFENGAGPEQSFNKIADFLASLLVQFVRFSLVFACFLYVTFADNISKR